MLFPYFKKEEINIKKVNYYGVEFEVTSCGKVFRNGLELRQNTNHDNYKVVWDGKSRNIGVHRLVALAYVENDDVENKVEVNHLDFDRQNNNFSNLKWVTHAENIRYSFEHGRYDHILRHGKHNPNYGNDTLKKKYKENPELALEKQSRKGLVNGMCKPISLYKDGKLISKFQYIGECCEYLHLNHGFSSDYEVIRCGIRRSIKNNVPYKGFTFVK